MTSSSAVSVMPRLLEPGPDQREERGEPSAHQSSNMSDMDIMTQQHETRPHPCHLMPLTNCPPPGADMEPAHILLSVLEQAESRSMKKHFEALRSQTNPFYIRICRVGSGKCLQRSILSGKYIFDPKKYPFDHDVRLIN